MKIKKHFQYLRYLIRHKWFVFVAGRQLRAPLWRLIIHDWSKFLPDEWFPYVDMFYDKDKANNRRLEAFSRFGVCEMAPFPFFIDDFFKIAWMKHQKRNPHHWEYWTRIVSPGDIGCAKAYVMPMPEKFIREMVSDWAGTGRAKHGKWDLRSWYCDQQSNIALHPETRARVVELIDAFVPPEITRTK